jgi:hypothetical protein
MELASTIGLIALGLTAVCSFGAFGLISIHEDERRAARVSFAAAVLTGLPPFLACLLPTTGQLIVLGTAATGAIG